MIWVVFLLSLADHFKRLLTSVKKNTNTRHYMKNIKKKGVRATLATLATQSRTERVLKTIQCIYDARGQDSIWEPIWHVQPIRKWHAPLRWPASLASLASRSNNKFLLVSLLPLPPSLCVSIILTRQPITNQFIFSTFSLLLLTSIRSNCLWIVVTAMKKKMFETFIYVIFNIKQLDNQPNKTFQEAFLCFSAGLFAIHTPKSSQLIYNITFNRLS